MQCASRCRRVLNDISAQKCSALREAAPAFGGWGAATWVPRAISTVASEGSPGASSQNPGEEVGLGFTHVCCARAAVWLSRVEWRARGTI